MFGIHIKLANIVSKIISSAAIASVLLSGISVFGGSTAYAKGSPYKTDVPMESDVEINCNSYILIDADSGQVLYEKNADKKIYPASTTKMMTSILALETLKPNSDVTVSQAAIDNIGPGGMNIGCVPDEVFKFKDIIKVVLLTSANECAYAIAENSADSCEDFIQRMNDKAEEIGAKNTHFTNVHGMFDKKHYTTARDLAAIARYAAVLSPASDKFINIVSKESYKLPPTNKHSVWYSSALHVTNKLRSFPSKYYKKVLGIKTGYIDASGNNFVGMVQDDKGRRLISVISGVPSTDSVGVFKYTQLLLDEGYKNYELQSVVSKKGFVDSITLNNLGGSQSTLDAYAKADLSAYLLTEDARSATDMNTDNSDEQEGSEAAEDAELIKSFDDSVSVPVKKGTVIGTAVLKVNGQTLGKTKLVAAEDVPYDFSPYKKRIITIYLIAALIIILSITLLGFMSKSRAKTARTAHRGKR